MGISEWEKGMHGKEKKGTEIACANLANPGLLDQAKGCKRDF